MILIDNGVLLFYWWKIFDIVIIVEDDYGIKMLGVYFDYDKNEILVVKMILSLIVEYDKE